ncbi:MAG: cupin domain-containing protein [Acidobacteriota bacterium]|nr:cupin domain-containing protein [Acidobacteriota bacterium]
MRKAQFLLTVSLLLCGGLIAEAQKNKQSISQNQNMAATVAEREIRDFFNSYAEDLRLHRGEAIAARYDSRGYYRMGNGTKTLVSFEDNKKRYMNDWAGPRSFEWKNLSIEVLSKNSAVVTALFDWQIGNSESRLYSYTGVLTKQSGEWRIRLEDESGAPLNLTTPITGNSSAAGAFKYLFKGLAGTSIAAHRHSVEQRITVRSGRKFILMGELTKTTAQIYEAGSSFTIPANTWHVEWWETDTIEEIEGTGPMLTERATPATPRVP